MKLQSKLSNATKMLEVDINNAFALWSSDRFVHIYIMSPQATLSFYPKYMILRQKEKEDITKYADKHRC
jgi:hypothetical protein